jgi:SAM-dependent methyltransferase
VATGRSRGWFDRPMTDSLMTVQQVRAVFDSPDWYLRGNTTLLVRMVLINEMLKGLSFFRYAELGCGDGSIALSLLDRDKSVVLVDVSEQMIEKARVNGAQSIGNRSNIEYVVKDIDSYQPDEKFDLILCVGVFAHVPSIEGLVAKLASMVKERGYLLIQFTERRSLAGWFMGTFMNNTQGYEMNQLSEKGLVPLIERHDFVLRDKRTYSDSGFGLGKLNRRLAYTFKLLSARLNAGLVFSERILLFGRRP